MATRKNAGLTVGQSLTLVFGFLLASVIIFVLGFWVGRGMSRQQEKLDRPIVLKHVETPGPGAGTDSPVSLAGVDSRATAVQAEDRPTRPRIDVPTATRTATVASTRTATIPAPATKTRRASSPSPVTRAPQSTPPSGVVWTVQATSTNDQVQALVTARGLRAKGYDSFTSQADVGGAKWFRIQVGKFGDKAEAEKMAARLRREGLEAAYVDRLR